MQLVHPRIKPRCANVLSEDVDNFSSVEVVGDQRCRMEAVHERGPSAPPSFVATAFFQGCAALGQMGKAKPGNLLEPERESRVRPFPHANSRNPRVENVQQFCLRQIPREMCGGNKSGGPTTKDCDSHTAISFRVSIGRSRCCTDRRACAIFGLDGAVRWSWSRCALS